MNYIDDQAKPHQAYDAKAWSVKSLPCPECKNMTVIGYLLVNESGEHMHTRYTCTFWASGTLKACGWTGWVVPGWDKQETEMDEDDDMVEVGDFGALAPRRDEEDD